VRQVFVRTLAQLAGQDERIVLLTADLGFMVMEEFQSAFPHRFFNVGVAEQNMVGVATGLAEAGFIPFTYSIATFASLRPFEFIRNGPVLHQLPVKMVGMGMGFDYGHAGPSHHAVEDIAVLRTLPSLDLVIPADSAQARAALMRTWDSGKPTYYSLSKDDTLSVPGLDGRFEPGHVQVVREGRDIVLAAMGSIAGEAVHASDELARQGIAATVVIVSNFHPDPVEDLRRILSDHQYVISVEAQALSGGLGALIGTVIATHGMECRLRCLAVSASPDGTSGSPRDRWKKHGLDRASIVSSALEIMGISSE
jgi:transketolase